MSPLKLLLCVTASLLTSSHALALKPPCFTSVRAERIIDAPYDLVFDTIVDTASYPEWNPYIIDVSPNVDISVVGTEFVLTVDQPFELFHTQSPRGPRRCCCRTGSVPSSSTGTTIPCWRDWSALRSGSSASRPCRPRARAIKARRPSAPSCCRCFHWRAYKPGFGCRRSLWSKRRKLATRLHRTDLGRDPPRSRASALCPWLARAAFREQQVHEARGGRLGFVVGRARPLVGFEDPVFGAVDRGHDHIEADHRDIERVRSAPRPRPERDELGSRRGWCRPCVTLAAPRTVSVCARGQHVVELVAASRTQRSVSASSGISLAPRSPRCGACSAARSARAPCARRRPITAAGVARRRPPARDRSRPCADRRRAHLLEQHGPARPRPRARWPCASVSGVRTPTLMPRPCSPRAGLTTSAPCSRRKARCRRALPASTCSGVRRPASRKQRERDALVVAAAQRDRGRQLAQRLAAHDRAPAVAQAKVLGALVEDLDLDAAPLAPPA